MHGNGVVLDFVRLRNHLVYSDRFLQRLLNWMRVVKQRLLLMRFWSILWLFWAFSFWMTFSMLLFALVVGWLWCCFWVRLVGLLLMMCLLLCSDMLSWSNISKRCLFRRLYWLLMR